MHRLAAIPAALALFTACGGGAGGGLISGARPPVIENPPDVVYCDFGARPRAGLQSEYWEQWCVRAKLMEGPYERYSLEGTLIVTGRYEKDAAVGKWVWNYDDGKRKIVGSFEEGSPVGEWEWRHNNGETAQRGGYSGGVRVGTWTTWFEDGTMASEGAFRKGERVGPWTFWNEQGELMREQEWTEGALVKNEAPEAAGIVE